MSTWDGKTRLSRRSSSPVSKKRRTHTESSSWNKFDPLFGISVDKDDLVLGDDRVWAQGITQFLRIAGTNLGNRDVGKLQRECIETFAFENKADIGTERDLILQALDTIPKMEHEPSFEPRQEFWLHVLAHLETAICDACKLETADAATTSGALDSSSSFVPLEAYLRLFSCGVQFLLVNNPREASDRVASLCALIRDPIYSDAKFWLYNPLRALPVAQWAVEWVDDVFHTLMSHSSELQDMSYVVSAHPWKPLKTVSDHTAQDEARARAWLNSHGATDDNDEGFDEELEGDEVIASGSIVNSLYDFIDATMLLRISGIVNGTPQQQPVWGGSLGNAILAAAANAHAPAEAHAPEGGADGMYTLADSINQPIDDEELR